jgi:site-specific DNA recombinase
MSVSQWEREAIGERTRDALRHKKAKRQIYSPTPYGFERRGSALAELAGESDTIAQIQQWRAAGDTLRQIADRLNHMKVPTKSGGTARWYASTVRAILTNSLYKVAA